MKKVTLILAIATLFVGCSSNETEVVPYNLKSDSLSYEGTKYHVMNMQSDVLNTKDKIQELCDKINRIAKRQLSNPETFTPLEIMITETSRDTAMVVIDYRSTNSYGVPAKITTYIDMIGGKLNEESILNIEP